ncbi:DNA-binding transcriptional ArsR family regulator [Kribbella aluminosa]|uniref:DNA-binding transcriptional ArsR family regulator n=1 Tax=Kribbella aluminosa TaxID=416017 RepID=A0ABS4UXQ6_9ACTN|nr:helix-turn-helix domain-containing protein [Kribbella aluminosa]MBP2356410.1 DNA-binding transcriptional ArsR family regulator [Kribbella aluminosa]
MDPLDLLLHPVRLRIVHAMSGGRVRTTSDLCARLSDVPKTSVYRHVALLAEGGVLEVVDEQRVHGAVERHYQLRADRTRIGPEAAATMTLDDHRRGFTATMAALLAEFNTYLDRPGANPLHDSVGYRQGILWLSEDELAALIKDIQQTLANYSGNSPAPGRTPRLHTMISFPVEPPEQTG